MKVLLSSFHLNGHTWGFHPQTQKFESPLHSKVSLSCFFFFKVTDAAVEQAKMLLTSTGPEPRTCLKQPLSASDSPLPSELQIKESVEVWNNTRETNLRYQQKFATLENEKRPWSRNAWRNCFWDRYWVRAGQLLANCSLSLITVPEVISKVNSSQFPSRFESGELLISYPDLSRYEVSE